jgi:hypothetical protein
VNVPVAYVPGDVVLLRSGRYSTRLGKIVGLNRVGRYRVRTWRIVAKVWGTAHPENPANVIGLAPPEYVNMVQRANGKV